MEGTRSRIKKIGFMELICMRMGLVIGRGGGGS